MERKTIGNRIRETRKASGYTQAELAQVLEISESYVALLEKDRRNPSIEVLIALGKTLGVTLDYLVWGNTADEKAQLYREWNAITQGHTTKEIRAAMEVVRLFLDCVDDNTDAQQHFY